MRLMGAAGGGAAKPEDSASSPFVSSSFLGSSAMMAQHLLAKRDACEVCVSGSRKEKPVVLMNGA